ncbi:hypothetical protein V6N13_115347 [Hibiscus sabdariffa]
MIDDTDDEQEKSSGFKVQLEKPKKERFKNVNNFGESEERQLFAASKTHSLQFFPPTVNDGEVVIKPPAEVFEAGVRVWQNSLVAQFLGKPLNLSTLHRLISVIWGKCGELEVNSAGENLFLIQFPSLEDRDWVLANGPWHIQNKPIILRKWQSNMQSLEFAMDSLPVWVHLRSVSLELFTSVGLSYIASALGVPLYMDSITANRQRLAYAKICVEMSAGFCVPKVIPVYLKDGSVALVGVEVPWLPPRCSRCCIFGHAENSCRVGHEPSKVWIPKGGIDTDDVKGKRVVTSKDVDIASSSMGSVLPFTGSVIGDNNGLGVTADKVVIAQGDQSAHLQGAASEIVPDAADNIVQDAMDMVVQGAARGAADYAQVQVSAIDLDVGAATHNVIGVEQENASTDEFIGVVVAPEGTCGSPKQIREAAKGVADLMQEIKIAKRNGKRGRKRGAGNNPSRS